MLTPKEHSLLEAFVANGPDALASDPGASARLLDAVAGDASLVGPFALLQLAPLALGFERVADAGFFFYLGQIRARTDIARYGWQDDGSSPATALGAFASAVGATINPAVMRDPAVFRQVVERVEACPPLPAPDARDMSFGGYTSTTAMAEGDAVRVAEEIKEGWVAYHRPLMEKLQDPAAANAFALVQDVNFGRVERTDANAAEIDAANELVQKILG